MSDLRAIWKYPLPRPREAITIPVGARILDLQMQGDVPTLWALVDPEAPIQERRFIGVATGQIFHAEHGQDYIGTFQMASGLVFHLFEVKS